MSQSNDIIELKRLWYQKLKESGFKDIEDTSRLQKDPYISVYDSKFFHTNFHPLQCENTQEYFRRARGFYCSHEFDSITDKKVWALHSEGKSHREIAQMLRSPNNKMNKDNVNQIILKLQSVMKDLEGLF